MPDCANGSRKRPHRYASALPRSSDSRIRISSIWCVRVRWSRTFWTFWMHPRPGEIWLADLGVAAKTRPVVIVSRLDPDPPRALIIYVPLTTQGRKSLYEVELPR